MATSPTGPIKTKIPNVSSPVQWEAITPYDQFIKKEAEPVGWPIERIRAHIVIESQGIPTATQQNNSNGWSYGLMQVVPFGVGWEGWHKLVKQKAGLPASASRDQVISALYDPAINIACGVAILESFYQQHGTTDKASSAFFTGRADWGAGDTVNGTTGKQYQAAMNGLIAEQKTFGDVIDRLYGGNPYTISAEYGQRITWSCPGCYDYQAAYGLDLQHHYAYDVSANAGDGAPLYAPFDGTVVCSGTNIGQGAWGTGCAAFPRLNNYGSPKANGWGAGRLEILHEDGDRSLIIGHVLNSQVSAGSKVKAGDYIGQQGGMNASHVHLEGRYANGTRIGDPRTLFPATTTTTPAQPPKAERIDIPQPGEFDRTWTVTVTENNTPVLQRANPNASAVAEPLAKGEQFEAAYLTISDETGDPYWVSKARGRVPARNTNLAEVLHITPAVNEGGITQETLNEVIATLDKLAANYQSDIVGLGETNTLLRAVIGNLKGVA